MSKWIEPAIFFLAVPGLPITILVLIRLTS